MEAYLDTPLPRAATTRKAARSQQVGRTDPARNGGGLSPSTGFMPIEQFKQTDGARLGATADLSVPARDVPASPRVAQRRTTSGAQ